MSASPLLTANQILLLGLPLYQEALKETLRVMRLGRATRVLAARFGELPPEIAAELDRVSDLEHADRLSGQAFYCSDLHSFLNELRLELSEDETE
jgi:hypothetical protein